MSSFDGRTFFCIILGMSRPLAVAVVLVSLLVPVAARVDRVDDYVTSRIGEYHLPGLSLVVIRKGAIVKAEGYGFADVESKVAAKTETVFKIGSVSKQFFATAIMLLAQDGRLGLGDPVSKHISGTPPAWAPITIRHLLTHTAGLVRESPAFDPAKQLPDADMIKAAFPVPLRFVPGEKWEYSNVGYYLLAEIIRVVSGQSWNDFLRARVFAPAGLTTTVPTGTAGVGPLASGYTGNDNSRKAAPFFPLRPSGAFLSTVLDLAKWDAVLDANRILREESRRQMWSPVTLSDGGTAPYGFGWHVQSLDGKLRVRHGGGLPGFAAEYMKYVDERLTVIVLTNGDDVDLPSIASGVAALYLAN
jgi:CubicO group peptidase (beta-lactamase class C family)